jgi:hypothetical protein
MPWYTDLARSQYVATYHSAKQLYAEAQLALVHGWHIIQVVRQQTSFRTTFLRVRGADAPNHVPSIPPPFAS